MPRGDGGSLFVGRLSKRTTTRDLEDIFETYGRLTRCELKFGAEMAYAFVDFEDRRDAEDAVKYENGREICGSSVIVEWAKGSPRRPMARGGGGDRGYGGYQGQDECYKCRRVGHWARDCPDDRNVGYRRQASSSSRYDRRRSPSPRRSSRRYSRSRSRERRHRSRSGSYDKRRDSRSRSRSHDSRSRSNSKKRSASRSKSKSASVERNGKVDQDRSPSPT